MFCFLQKTLEVSQLVSYYGSCFSFSEDHCAGSIKWFIPIYISTMITESSYPSLQHLFLSFIIKQPNMGILRLLHFGYFKWWFLWVWYCINIMFIAFAKLNSKSFLSRIVLFPLLNSLSSHQPFLGLVTSTDLILFCAAASTLALFTRW